VALATFPPPPPQPSLLSVLPRMSFELCCSEYFLSCCLPFCLSLISFCLSHCWCRGLHCTRPHTQTQLGRAPLDEWSARRRGRYLHSRQPTQETNIRALRYTRSCFEHCAASPQCAHFCLFAFHNGAAAQVARHRAGCHGRSRVPGDRSAKFTEVIDILVEKMCRRIVDRFWLYLAHLAMTQVASSTHITHRQTSAAYRMLWRHCAASRKVKGLISDGVTGIFHGLHPSSSPVDLGSTLPLTEMSFRDLPWGGGVKAAGA
jgi:hypothetical protein